MAGTDYVVNAADATSPLDTNIARKGAAELRALKARVNSVVIGAAGNITQTRQTVLQGLLAAGIPAALAISGTVLGVDLKGTTIAVIMAFAAGFTATGAADAIEQITADQANYWPLVPVSNTSYLTTTRVGPGVVTAGQTLAPPQYGDTYNQGAQSVLQFGGAAGTFVFLDDFGPTWARGGGAKIQTNYFKFGTGALGGGGAGNAMDGATDRLSTNNITTMGNGSWAMRCWCKPLNAFPGVGAATMLASFGTATNFGVRMAVYNLGGVTRFAMALSSTGAADDILALTQGTTIIALGTEYFVEVTFDALAGVYRLYVNGIQEASVASALKICGGIALVIGAVVSGGAGTFFQGYIDKFEFLPYCQHPAGTAYAVPTSAPNVLTAGYASDWFDTSQMLMKSISAASIAASSNPTFIPINKLYIGEADTSAVAVTAVRTYAYQGKYISAPITPLAGANVTLTFNHNIGTDKIKPKLQLINLVTSLGYTPGQIATEIFAFNAGNFPFPLVIRRSKNSAFVQTGSTASFALQNVATGDYSSLTAGSFAYQLVAERSF